MENLSQIGMPSLATVVKVRPMVMFTGFLGAGKTTFLRDFLGSLADKKIDSDVILNDRENAHIDKATLEDRAAEVEALTGSCVCCEGFNDLMKVIMKASQSNHDVLLIELNGTADPVPLQQSFTLLESKFCLRPRWQVCVIDARHFRNRKKFNDLESLQLETASHYYISWDVDLTKEEERRIERGIQDINSVATRTTALELADALGQAISKNNSHALAPKKLERTLNSVFDIGGVSPSKEDHHERHKLAHEFTGCQIIIPEPVSEENVVNWLDNLPESVIRAKALLTLKDDVDRLHLFERVGLFTSPNSVSAQRKTERPSSGIFIGPDLDPDKILKITQEYLHPRCHFPKDENDASSG